MTPRVLEKIAEIMDRAPAARRTVLALILEDPQRVLDETFETLAQRANSSVPTIMRTCRDLGYPGLREFKLALAQELAVGGSPLNRRVRIDDDTRQVIARCGLMACRYLPMSRRRRGIMRLAWWIVGWGPLPLARSALRWTLQAESRPAIVKQLAKLLRAAAG